MQEWEQKDVSKQKWTFAAWGAAFGATACAIFCGAALGLELPSTAQQQTQSAVQLAVSKVLAPSCAAQFIPNKAAVAKFIAAQEQGYGRDGVVSDTIKSVEGVAMNDDLDSACVAAITQGLKRQAKTTPTATAGQKS